MTSLGVDRDAGVLASVQVQVLKLTNDGFATVSRVTGEPGGEEPSDLVSHICPVFRCIQVVPAWIRFM